MAVHLYLPHAESLCGPAMRDIDGRVRPGCQGTPQASVEFRVKALLDESKVYLFPSVIDQIVTALRSGQPLVFHYANN